VQERFWELFGEAVRGRLPCTGIEGVMPALDRGEVYPDPYPCLLRGGASSRSGKRKAARQARRRVGPDDRTLKKNRLRAGIRVGLGQVSGQKSG